MTGSRAEAPRFLVNPLATTVERDFRPKPGALKGTPLDVRDYAGLAGGDRDFDGRPRDRSVRGAYGGEAPPGAWLPNVESRP